jgi:hypothetical protein
MPRAYSDDLRCKLLQVNPIEQCWAKIKEFLRGAKTRLCDALEQAITAAVANITQENSVAWFHHCGDSDTTTLKPC